MERFDLENFPISESAKNMIASVSDGFYDNSYVGKWLYEVMGQEYDTAREIAEDLINQLFPETATWGLKSNGDCQCERIFPTRKDGR